MATMMTSVQVRETALGGRPRRALNALALVVFSLAAAMHALQSQRSAAHYAAACAACSGTVHSACGHSESFRKHRGTTARTPAGRTRSASVCASDASPQALTRRGCS